MVSGAPGEDGDPGGGEGLGFGGEKKSWAKIARGPTQPVRWTSEKASPAEIDELQKVFTTVLELPEVRIEAARSQWEGRSVIARSLGRCVPVEWVAREIHHRAQLGEPPEVFMVAEEHLVLRFATTEECDRVLYGGPWVVAGQHLATEPWRADFVLGLLPISRTTVWVHLPGLPLEYWDLEVLRMVAAMVGRPLALDAFTEQCRKAGYARIRVEVDTTAPLCPEVSIRGCAGIFWQPVLCFGCGQMGHPMEQCTHQKDQATGDGARGGKPCFGPWMVTTRVRAPKPAMAELKAANGGLQPQRQANCSTKAPQPGASSSELREASTVPTGESVWLKPSKVARR